MKPCPCWSCTLYRALRRARWLFTHARRDRLDEALGHGISLAEQWGGVRYDAQRGLPTIIEGRRYVPAERRPTDETEGEDTV